MSSKTLRPGLEPCWPCGILYTLITRIQTYPLFFFGLKIKGINFFLILFPMSGDGKEGERKKKEVTPQQVYDTIIHPCLQPVMGHGHTCTQFREGLWTWPLNVSMWVSLQSILLLLYHCLAPQSWLLSMHLWKHSWCSYSNILNMFTLLGETYRKCQVKIYRKFYF